MNETLVFFGFGKISNALIKGFISHGEISASNIYVYSRHQDAVKSLGCTPLEPTENPTSDITKFLANSYVTAFICVKPHQFSSIVKPMISCLRKSVEGCIVSVMAGITLKTIQNAFVSLEKFSIARSIPNLAVEFGKGVWAWTSAKESDCRGLQKLLERVSFAPFVEEKDIDIVCALSGSGIAYLIAIAEAMKTSAVFNGMNSNLARKIINSALIGCGTLLGSSEIHPNQIIDQICSPGGTTIHGLTELQRANVYDGVTSAVNATVRRAQELSTINQDDEKL